MNDRFTARELAVIAVDGLHGYTAEFSSHPDEHRRQYDIAEGAIRAATENKDHIDLMLDAEVIEDLRNREHGLQKAAGE